MLGNLFRALRHRNYRLFFIGQSLSNIGTWLQQVAMGWLTYQQAHWAWVILLGARNGGPLAGSSEEVRCIVGAEDKGILALRAGDRGVDRDRRSAVDRHLQSLGGARDSRGRRDDGQRRDRVPR